MIFRRKFRLFNDGEQDNGSGLDISAAVDSIGADLGFGSKPDDGAGGGDGVDEPDLESGRADADVGRLPVAIPAPTAPPVATPAPTAPPAGTPPGTGTGAPPPKFTAETAPSTWTAASQAQWGGLPPAIREEIAKRENDMVRGIEQYRSEANIGRLMHKAVEPALGQLQQAQIPPQHFVANLVQAHMLLSSDKVSAEQKSAYVTKLLSDYGITAPPAEGTAEAAGFIDPEVKALRETVSRLESRLNGEDQRKSNEVRAQLAKDVDAFASDPANVHWAEVADDMTLLVRANPNLTLKEAYEKAVWANPTTRALEVTRQQTEAVEKARKEAAEAAEKAKGAKGTRVRTVGHQGSGTAATGSMDDTMQETLRNIRKRE
jgi:hypothetical protein